MTTIRISSKPFRAASLVAALLALPAMTHAIPIPIAGAGPWGSFGGTFDYVAGGSESTNPYTVFITLTNTSSPANGGYITAFAFNLPDAEVVGFVDLTVAAPNFGLMSGPDSIAAPPLGFFDIGATTDPGGSPPGTDPSWLGGGDPARGIGVGLTGNFQFQLIVSEAWTADQILSTLSIPTSPGLDGHPFAVRFRGFENGESDKVVGGVVPEPGTLLLLGGGLTALGLRRRRPRG